MSESAVILEGEVARRFNPVDKLRATNQDSSVSDWVPSDTLDLGSLMASENTLYLANIDDDCDAYEEVEVDVSEELEDGDYKKITGKGNDGNDYAVGLDENGNLTSEMVPSAIHIVIKPRKLEYEDGETLDFTGIHVYLMDGNNQRFTSDDYPTGEIPFEELVFPVTTAEGEAGLEEWSDGSINAYKIHYSQFATYYNGEFRGYAYYSEAIGTNENGNVYLGGGNSEASLFATQYQGRLYVALIEGDNTHYDLYDDAPVVDWEGIKNLKAGTSGRSKEGYFVSAWDPGYATFMVPTSNVDPSGRSIEDMIYSGGSGGIPVQWMRSDGEMLEDRFLITITEGNNTSGSESGHSGTSDSGSGHTSGGF